ncbi:MAG: PEP-CTERM sorting domain-containing protein [Pseudomonadota bacterium]
MNNCKLISRLLLVAGTMYALPSAATVVNISAADEYWSYHYSPIIFGAGEYRITPIGRDEGGLYDAWIAWGAGQLGGGDVSCSPDGACDKGWLNSYSFGYVGPNDFVYELATVGGRVDEGTAIVYATPALALSNAQSYEFELATETKLYFYIRDFPSTSAYSDNGGGISLKIERIVPVPEPESYVLMLSGLGLIMLVARRSKQNQSA